jgi:hypothetical protein
VGHPLIAFRASGTRDRRKGAAVGTAHDELQVAVAYLCHGDFLLALYLNPNFVVAGLVFQGLKPSLLPG